MTNHVPVSKWIAIDLGTENLRYANAAELLSNGEAKVTILSKSDRKSSVPALFTFKNGKRIVGVRAKETKCTNIIADATVIRAQNAPQQKQNSNGRMMKCYAEVDKNGYYRFIDGQREIFLSQTEAIAALLANIRASVFPEFLNGDYDAADVIGPVNAVIVVPSFADQQHRQIVVQAAYIAGFSTIQLINQSVAVAIAFRSQNYYNGNSMVSQHSNKLAILNIGARSIECSVLDFNYPTPKLLAAQGCLDFGGVNFTEELLKFVLEYSFGQDYQQFTVHKQLLKDLWDSCEKAKEELAIDDDDETCIKFFDGNEERSITLELKQFEQVCAEQFEKVEKILRKTFAIQKPGAIILAGASARLKKLKTILAIITGPNCPVLSESTNVPEEMAIRGAAVKAAWLNYMRNDIKVPNCFVRAMVDDFSYTKILCKSTSGHSHYLAKLGTPLPVQHCEEEELVNCQQYCIANAQIFENGVRLGKFAIPVDCVVHYRIDTSGIFSFKGFDRWQDRAQFPLLLDKEHEEQARIRILIYEQGIRQANLEAKREREEEQKRKKEEVERKKRELEKAERKKKELEEEEKMRKNMEEAERKMKLDEEIEEMKTERKVREEAERMRKGNEELGREEMEESEGEIERNLELASLMDVGEQQQRTRDECKWKLSAEKQYGSPGIMRTEVPPKDIASTSGQQKQQQCCGGGHSSGTNNSMAPETNNKNGQKFNCWNQPKENKAPSARLNNDIFGIIYEDMIKVESVLKKFCPLDLMLFNKIYNLQKACNLIKSGHQPCNSIMYSAIVNEAERLWTVGRVMHTMREALKLVKKHEEGTFRKGFPPGFAVGLSDAFLIGLRDSSYELSKAALLEQFQKFACTVMSADSYAYKLPENDWQKLKELCRTRFPDNDNYSMMDQFR